MKWNNTARAMYVRMFLEAVDAELHARSTGETTDASYTDGCVATIAAATQMSGSEVRDLIAKLADITYRIEHLEEEAED